MAGIHCIIFLKLSFKHSRLASLIWIWPFLKAVNLSFWYLRFVVPFLFFGICLPIPLYFFSAARILQWCRLLTQMRIRQRSFWLIDWLIVVNPLAHWLPLGPSAIDRVAGSGVNVFCSFVADVNLFAWITSSDSLCHQASLALGTDYVSFGFFSWSFSKLGWMRVESCLILILECLLRLRWPAF